MHRSSQSIWMFDQKAIARMAHIPIISAMGVCFILYTLYYVRCYEIVTAVTDNYSSSAFSPFEKGEIVSKTLQVPSARRGVIIVVIVSSCSKTYHTYHQSLLLSY